MPLELSMKFLQSSDSIQAFKQDSAVCALLLILITIAQSCPIKRHRVSSIFLQLFVVLVIEVVVVEVVVVVVIVVVVVAILKENKLVTTS